jgi:hypothetical protein
MSPLNRSLGRKAIVGPVVAAVAAVAAAAVPAGATPAPALRAASGSVHTDAINPACVGPTGLLGPFGPLGPAGPLGPTGVILTNPLAYPFVFNAIWFGSPAAPGLLQVCF